MAGKSWTSFNVVVCLVVLAAATAQGQILNALNLTSKVCCTPSGNCSPGAAGLANVTGVLSCANLLTGVVTQVGQGISNANGTLTISVTPKNILGGVLGVVSGVVPCVLTDTFALVNQTLCPSSTSSTPPLPPSPRLLPSSLAYLPVSLLGVLVPSISSKSTPPSESDWAPPLVDTIPSIMLYE